MDFYYTIRMQNGGKTYVENLFIEQINSNCHCCWFLGIQNCFTALIFNINRVSVNTDLQKIVTFPWIRMEPNHGTSKIWRRTVSFIKWVSPFIKTLYAVFYYLLNHTIRLVYTLLSFGYALKFIRTILD